MNKVDILDFKIFFVHAIAQNSSAGGAFSP